MRHQTSAFIGIGCLLVLWMGHLLLVSSICRNKNKVRVGMCPLCPNEAVAAAEVGFNVGMAVEDVHVEPPFLAVIVCSRGGVQGMLERRSFRETSLLALYRAASVKNVSIRHVFLLGSEHANVSQGEEDSDAISVTGTRSEHDLFTRVHAGLKMCQDAAFVLKTDTDAFIRGDVILDELLRIYAGEQLLYWGREVGPGKEVEWMECAQYLEVPVHARCPRCVLYPSMPSNTYKYG